MVIQPPTGFTSDINNINAMYLGKHIRTYPDIFDGSMDEVMVYNRALTSEEIQNLYNYFF